MGGPDPSWWGGLYMATGRGLQFGSEVIYTYGPLGFLRFTMVWDSGLVVFSLLYCSLIFVSLCIGLVEISRRAVGPLWACFLTFIMFALLTSIEQPVILAVILCGLVLRRDRSDRSVELTALAGGALAATEILVKFTTGPVILLVLVVGLFGARATRRQALVFAASFLVTLAAFWLVSGQDPGGFPDYLINGFGLAFAYGDAMALDFLPLWQALVTALVAVAAVVLTVRGDYREKRARIAAIVVTAVVVFALFKQGITRYDEGHLISCLSSLVVLCLAIPAGARRKIEVMAVVLMVSAATLFVVPDARKGSTGTVGIFPPGNSASGVNVVSNLGDFGEQIANLFDSGRRDRLQEEGRASLIAGYGLDGPTLKALEGHRVAVDPSEIAIAWAYRLDWAPVPTLQNFMAFTTDLDRRNAEALTSENGPDRLLRVSPEIVYSIDPPVGTDGRHPTWDPPGQQRTAYCRFRPLVTGPQWQVLGRAGNRCGPLEPLDEVSSSYGETVEVPDPGPGAVTVLKLHGTEVKGLEKLRALFLRARQRYLVVNGYTGYRLPPLTGTDGLMVRGGAPDAEGNLPREIPQAETLELTGGSGDLLYEFFRMPLTNPGSKTP